MLEKTLQPIYIASKMEKTEHEILQLMEIFEYDIDTEEALLDTYCEKADFVFNLAGVEPAKRPVRVHGWKILDLHRNCWIH